jgi:hypothetical protein
MNNIRKVQRYFNPSIERKRISFKEAITDRHPIDPNTRSSARPLKIEGIPGNNCQPLVVQRAEKWRVAQALYIMDNTEAMGQDLCPVKGRSAGIKEPGRTDSMYEVEKWFKTTNRSLQKELRKNALLLGIMPAVGGLAYISLTALIFGAWGIGITAIPFLLGYLPGKGIAKLIKKYLPDCNSHGIVKRSIRRAADLMPSGMGLACMIALSPYPVAGSLLFISSLMMAHYALHGLNYWRSVDKYTKALDCARKISELDMPVSVGISFDKKMAYLLEGKKADDIREEDNRVIVRDALARVRDEYETGRMSADQVERYIQNIDEVYPDEVRQVFKVAT